VGDSRYAEATLDLLPFEPHVCALLKSWGETQSGTATEMSVFSGFLSLSLSLSPSRRLRFATRKIISVHVNPRAEMSRLKTELEEVTYIIPGFG